MKTSNETFPGQHDANHIMYVIIFTVMIPVDFIQLFVWHIASIYMHLVSNTCFEAHLPLHESVDISPNLAPPSLVLYSNCLGYLSSVHTDL
jgi:hypothetical protein